MLFFDVPTADSTDNTVMADVLGNKTDTHSGNSVYALLNKSSEHIHSRQYVYPTLADAITITTSASNWTFGAWTEVIPVSTITSDFDIHWVVISDISANDEFEIQIGSGAGGSEAVVASTNFVRDTVQAQQGAQPVVMAIVAANTRIAVRLACKSGTSKTCNVKVNYHIY